MKKPEQYSRVSSRLHQAIATPVRSVLAVAIMTAIAVVIGAVPASAGTAPNAPTGITAVVGSTWVLQGASGPGANEWSVLSPGTAGASWNYAGDGAASGSQYAYSKSITVVPGTTYTLAGTLNATYATANSPYVAIDAPSASSSYLTLPQTPGANSTLSGTWTVPSGVTQVVILVGTANSTVASGQAMSWSNLSLTDSAGDPNAIPDYALSGAISPSNLVTVYWSPPLSVGGDPITSYTATATPGGFSCTSALTSCVVSGLSADSAYTFSVTATNVDGTGPASANYDTLVSSLSPVAWYKLADAAGSTSAVDSSGSGNTLTAHPAVTFGGAGPILSTPSDTSASFSSSALLGASGLTESASWSASVWAKTSAASSSPTAISFNIPGSWSNDMLILYIGETAEGGGTRVWWDNGSRMTTGAPVADGNWHFYVLELSGTTLSLYIDGSLAGTSAVSAEAFTPTSLSLGAANNSGTLSQYFNGALSQAAVFNYALTPAQIATLDTAGQVTPLPVATAPANLDITLGQVTTTGTLSFTPTSAPLIVSPGMAYIAAGTEIYLVNMYTGAATLAFGSSTSGCTNSTNPASVTFSGITALATDGTYLYVGSEGSCGDPMAIRKVNLTSGATTTLYGGGTYTGVVGLVFATNGYLYATAFSYMYKINPTTGTETTITTSSFGLVVFGIYFPLYSPTQDGSVIYVAADPGDTPYQEVFSYNITTGVASGTSLPVTAGGAPDWMAAAGSYVYSVTAGATNLSVTGPSGTSVIAGTGVAGVQDGTGSVSWPNADGAWFNDIGSVAVDGSGLWVLDGRLIRNIVQGATSTPAPAVAPTTLDLPVSQVTTMGTLPLTPTAPPLLVGPATAYMTNGTEIFSVNLDTEVATPLIGSATAGCTNSLNPANVAFHGITSLTSDGTYLYVYSSYCGLQRTALTGPNPGATTALPSLSNVYSGVRSIVYAANGDLYYAGGNSLYRYNPVTGTNATITSNVFGTDTNPNQPCGFGTGLIQNGPVLYITGCGIGFSYNLSTGVASGDPGVTGGAEAAAGAYLYRTTGSSSQNLDIYSVVANASAVIAGNGTSAIVDGVGATAEFGDITSIVSTPTGLWVIDGSHVRWVFEPATAPTEAETYNQFEPQDGCRCGDPVDMATGSLAESYNDLSIPGPGGGLNFTRSYNSLNGIVLGPLGYGWADNYQMSLSTNSVLGTATITEPTGATITFTDGTIGGTYDAPPKVEGALSSTGSGTSIVYTFTARSTHTSYVFNHLGVLTDIVDQDGNTTALTYNGSGQLTKVTDPSGRTLTLAYTGSLLSSVTDPMGRVWSYAYTSSNLTSATDPRGKTTTYGYSGHLLTSITDPNGNVTANTYNAANQVTTQVDGAELTTTWSYSGNPLTTSSTVMTSPQGAQTQFNFSDYQLTSKTEGYGSSTPATTAYAYSPTTSEITSVVEPDGVETAYTYDGSGDLTSKSLFPSSNPSSAETWAYTYNASGDLLTATSPMGETTTNTYNADNNLLTPTDPMGNATSYSYSTSGIVGELLTKTNPLGGVTTYGYDSAGDQTSVAATVASGVTNTSRATYNADSQVICQVSPNEVALGVTCPGSVPYPSGTTGYTYDADGNVLSVTSPLGGVTTNVYDNDGNLLTTTDPVGNITKTTYNGDSQPLTVTSGYASSTPSTVTYAYDLSSTNPACPAVSSVLWCNTTTDGSGKISATGYNVLGQKVAFSGPSGGTTVRTYSPGGELLTATDASGNVTTNTYTSFGEVASVSYSDSTPTANYTYDADGRRTEMTDGIGSTTYTYNADSNLTLVTQPVVGGGTATIGYTYDANGDELTITYPGSDVVTYTYNEGGQMTSTEDWNANTTSYTYDADSNLLATTSPGDLIANTYDANDNLASVTLSSSGSTLGTIVYTRDADGQITNEADTGTFTGGNTNTYNSLGQLTSYGSTSLSYEPSGEITTNGTTTNTVATNGQLSSTSSGTAYGYDSAGNRTSATTSSATQNNTFNAANELVSVTSTPTGGSPAALETNVYTGDGLLAASTNGSGTTTFLYDPQNSNQLVEAGGTGYIYGPQRTPIEQITGTTVDYLVPDAIGSTRALVGATGTVDATTSYSPYGQVTATTGTPSAIGFAGTYTDSTTNMDYMVNRWYDPEVGEFVSVDPLVAATNQAYEYASGDPVTIIDPLGLWFGLDDLIATAIGAVTGALVSTVEQEVEHGTVNWAEVGISAGAGAVAGEATLYCGPACGGAIGSVLNTAGQELYTCGTVNPGQVLVSAVVGGAAGWLGGGNWTGSGSTTTPGSQIFIGVSLGFTGDWWIATAQNKEMG